jgi:Ser/Thr protein kinase RdoA (MazF antagonist)
MSSLNILADVAGEPISPALLSWTSLDLVPGSELKQAGSHTALLRDGAGLESSTMFIKKVTASMVSRKSWNDRRRVLLYIRNEIRFYDEFATDLRHRGVSIPASFHLEAHQLDGIEGYEEEPPANVLERCGALMLIEPLADRARYAQTSPLSPVQARCVLAAAARLHAAAWEDRVLLERAALRLQRYGGSFALSARNPKELRELNASWEAFMKAFTPLAPAGFFERPEISSLGSRLAAAAPWISSQLSPSPQDRWATLVHGDLKAMNVFLPVHWHSGDSGGRGGDGAVLIDFASTGVGIAMADVAMHLAHALTPADLEGGGEEALIDAYLAELAAARGASASLYPRDLALRHFRLGVCDYGRFVMGRFWASATPESFAANAPNPNVVLANRNVAAALHLVERVHECLLSFEGEIATA